MRFLKLSTVAKHSRVFSKDELTQEGHKGTWFLFSEKGQLLKATAPPCSRLEKNMVW